MLLLTAGLLCFLVPHSMNIVAPAWRESIIAARGQGAWLWPYTGVSAIGLVLIIFGYGMARQDPILLYVPHTGLRHLALGLMLPVFPLLLASYLPGRIKAVVKHPMLLATVLWALAHLSVNGTLADVLLFGSLLVWAISDWISVARRPAKAQYTLPRAPFNDVIAVFGGVALYAAFIFGLHLVLFGVSPI